MFGADVASLFDVRRNLRSMAIHQAMLLPSLVGILVWALHVFRKWVSTSRRTRQDLPPGPPSLPLLGNALQLPQVKPWETFGNWAARYGQGLHICFKGVCILTFFSGDVIHLSVAGRHITILSSPEHVHKLLDSKAAIYSDRPIVPMAGQLVGFDRGLTMSQEGGWHREVRKTMASVIGASALKSLQGNQVGYLIRIR